MTNSFTKKRFIAGTLIVLVCSLVSMGVRLPSLTGLSSNSGKPKPRPRAVIQNQIKTCKEVIKKQATDCALATVVHVPVTTLAYSSRERAPREFHADIISSFPARAPPIFS